MSGSKTFRGGPQARLKITAVIPLFNGQDFIARSLGSVLAQTRPVDEIIVIDDGSTDDGVAVAVHSAAGDDRVRILAQQNRGQSSARNLGVSSSSGDLIAFLDQDDWWYPRHIAELEKPFFEVRSKPLGWSYSDLDEFDGDGRTIEHNMLSRLKTAHPKKTIQDCLRQDMYVLPSAALVSRAAFDAVAGFDERLCGYEDDDLFLQIFRAGYDNVFIPEALSAWCIHRQSSSHRSTMQRSGLIYAAKLLANYPDDPYRERFFTRDMIAPRFARVALYAAAQAAVSGQKADYLQAVSSLHVLAPRMRWKTRMKLSFLRNALRFYPLARLGASMRLHKLVWRSF